VIIAALAEATKRKWMMNVAVADSGGNLVAFQRMDGAMLASVQIAMHKARAAVTFRRPTKVFEDGIHLMHLTYLLAFDGISENFDISGLPCDAMEQISAISTRQRFNLVTGTGIPGFIAKGNDC